ncbi:MAG: hypothetical protein ACQEQO_07290 [Thermodesulfobacteriota bacterium]
MKGCCLFATYQWGKPRTPIHRGNADEAKLPPGYVAEKTNPGALELKKSRPSFGKYEFCKALGGW